MTMSRILRRKKPLLYLLAILFTVYSISQYFREQLCATSISLVKSSFCSPTYRSSGFNIFYHLGGNGPWIPKLSALGHADDPLPTGCTVNQVHMLSRHAERFPTRNAGNRHLILLERLSQPDVIIRGSLSFLKTWIYFADPGDADFENLTKLGPYAGTLQAFNTGHKLRRRYGHLVSRDRATKFWSCDSGRDIETARYFADGFFGQKWANDSSAELVIIPETAERGGNTLTPGDTCLKYLTDVYGHDYGYHQLGIWQQTFAPAIARRLSNDLQGVDLSPLDIYSMMEMCGFEILARGYSSWCNVFTHTEWLQFEYARDLLHFYRAGPGNQYAAAMGWLWLNATTELLVNNTDQNVYFSFVHDGDIVPMLAALQIFDEKTIVQDLPVDQIKENRRWRTSDVVPMGGRVNFERVTCGTQKDGNDNKQYVRIFVNDGLVKMPGMPNSQDLPHAIDMHDFQAFVASRLELFGDFRQICGLKDNAPSRITFLRQW